MLNFRQLEVFRAIMLTGTMSAAAEMVHASQPGLSRMIKHMEGRLGFLLFDRIRGRLVPTPEARTLFREIDQLHHGLENLEHVVRRLASGDGQLFRLGASPSLSRGFAPDLLARLRAAHPGVVLQFDVLSMEQVIDQLANGRSEYALTIYDIDHPMLTGIRIGVTPMIAVLPAGHRLVGNSPISIADLATEPFVGFPAESPHGMAITELCARSRTALDVRTRVRFAETACALVAGGIGVTIVDAQTGRDAGYAGLRSVRLRSAVAMTVNLYRNRNMPRTRIGATFERICRRVGPGVLAEAIA